jgi:peptidase C25-like protein
MKKSLLSLFVLVLFTRTASAQIINGQDTLYGNEWINFDQSYFKIPVATDGIYRLTQQTLLDAGVPLPQFTGAQLQIFHNGEEIPLFVTTDGTLFGSDYVEFYGKKNTSELDRHLFKNPDEDMMNPRYSLITDTAAYFLTWSSTVAPRRFEAVANDLSNLPPKEEFYQHELVLNYFNYFFKKQDSNGISSSDFGATEGFAGNYANAQVFNLNPSNMAATGGDAQLTIRYAGNLGNHQQAITLSGQPLVTDEFYGYVVRQLAFDIPNSALSNSMELKFQGLASSNDKQRISNLELRYPRLFNFENKTSFSFKIAASPAKKYIEVESFNSGGAAPVLYDLTNALRVETTLANGVVKFVLPPSAQQRSLILVNKNAGVNTALTPTPVTFIDYSAIDADYVIVSNPRLYDDGNGNNRVQEYADYRSSAVGGNFSTLIVDVQQLYDQFGWGLNRHPQAIRDFAHFINKNWASPRYFFIIGKGREYRNVRTSGQLSSPSNESNYVPTFGYPGSDNLLLAGGDEFTPIIPVGRIAASDADDIRVYLNKVKEFEANRDLPQTIADRAWTKRLMHLGGGAQPGEQSLIKSYLANLENIIEDSEMGGSVKSFFKTSTDPIQIPQTQQLFDDINDGISVLTFFGHSGVGTFDFSIDNPENYENTPKYPLMISLGCYSGNIHTSTVGVSERFVLFDKGAIAFTATSGLGFVSSLYVFATEYYRLMGNDMYGEGLGDILQKTIENVNNGGYGANLIRQQMSFHGDPAIHLVSAAGPDYLVDASSVSFSPSQVNISLDSFEIQFKAVNIGTHTPDSIVVQVTQEMPSGIQKTVVDELVPSPGFEEEQTFIIPTGGKEAVGQNRYYIKVDATGRVDELPLPAAETNNDLVSGSGVTGISLFITDNSAVAVYPAEFSIVSSPDIVLKASTTNALLPPRKYLFELDTTEAFDSPLKLETTLVQAGGVLKWQPPMTWQDSMVYYWRVSPDSLSPQEGFAWSTSSFTFIPGSPPGWSQSHFYQFKKDEFVNMELPTPFNLKYITNFKDFNIRNAVNTVEAVDIRVNNAYYGRYWGLPDAGVYVLWMDSVFVEPKVNFPPGDGPYQYGISHPSGWWVRTFMFDASGPAGRKDLMDFLDDVIADHEYVALFTVQKNPSSDYKPQEWAADSLIYGKNIFQILEAQGANLVRQLETLGSLPYIFAYQKGGGVIDEQIASSLTSVLNLYFSLPGYWDRGYIQTPIIGPAKKWSSLTWQAYSETNPETDTINLQLSGVAQNGITETLLIDSMLPGITDLSWINANDFPLLKLRFNSKDAVYRSTAQLDSWQVFFEGVPEFAVNPAAYFSMKNDTLQQGEPLRLKFAVENLSAENGDSLLVKFTHRDNSNEEVSYFQRFGPLAANDTLITHWQLYSQALKDRYFLSAEINPDGDQPESTHVNNFLNTGFFVQADQRNPLLDVTFDGTHILDGDIVSTNPNIVITLKDENSYLSIGDTSLMKVFILYPDSADVPLLVPFSDPAVTFVPASAGGENKATVTFSPTFTRDGRYELVVQARDATGNASGQYDYKAGFQVITKSMISSVLNYPNPFSTATRFMYTLTGNSPPAQYKIQIMTVTGRIVREVTQNELGPLDPGTHLTDFVWDGTDEFGDRLANGVYLYRFLAKDEEGNDWETYETGADAFVKNGVGKMVLLR